MVYVTGLGIITSIGDNVAANLNSLRNSQPGIGRSLFFDSRYASDFFFGEVPHSTNDLLNMSGLGKDKSLTRTDALAFKAFDEAVADAGLSLGELNAYETAFISAGTVGGMCAHSSLLADAQPQGFSSPHLFSYQFGAHTIRIAQHYALKGHTNTINTACSSSSNAIIMGVNLIRSGRAKRVIAGGCDALAKYTANGFDALRILSDTPCKPFDVSRKGLSLGEGAAYLVLEGEQTASNKTKYARITGYGNANDTFHPSSLSEDAGAVIKAMTDAIQQSHCRADDIGYINTHGTATENNDKVELLGLCDVFEKLPPYNATKSYTGHTLGASGAVEAVFSILSLYHDELYKSLNCEKPINENYPPIKAFVDKAGLKNVLSNSFGFGGNCTSLIFSKTE